MTSHTRTGLRTVAMAAAIAMTLGAAAACGSDAGDDGSSATTRHERQIRAVVADVQDALARTDGRSGCAVMSAAVRRALAQAAAGGGCARGFRAHFTSGEILDDPDPKIVAVEVDGRRAVVKARAKDRWATYNRLHAERKETLQRAVLVREGGRWRLQRWFSD